MAQYFDVHPENPQARSIAQVARILRDGGLIVYPTDSSWALGATVGNADALDRIRRIRQLGSDHHFTIVVDEFAKLGEFVQMDNWVFRAVKAVTPGAYTFILPATREVPRRMQHAKKKSVGVRIPDHVTTRALLHELGEPLLTSTLILPGDEELPEFGWDIKERLEHDVDAVLDSGDVGTGPTTVVDLTGDEPQVVRLGAGDPSPFE